MQRLFLAFLANPVWSWVHRLGGPGLILLGIADNSLVPMPGSMDVFVILLAAHRRNWWPYYAFMATLGAVLGGYITYRLAEKGGEETLEKKIGKARAQKVYERFEKHGFTTVFIGTILPPPFPTVPFLMAAGVLHYPRKNFLLAVSTGRALRFFAVAYVGRTYGHFIISTLDRYYRPMLYSLIALAVVAAVVSLVYAKWYRPRTQRARGHRVEDWRPPGHQSDGRKREWAKRARK
jgi:membrane protein YqaA with SNARE-associated domain